MICQVLSKAEDKKKRMAIVENAKEESLVEVSDASCQNKVFRKSLQITGELFGRWLN